MGDIHGVDHKGRLHRQSLELVDRCPERSESVWVGRLVEPDMAVAKLQKGQPARFSGHCLANEAQGTRRAPGDGPYNAGSGPSHAFQNLTSAYAASVVVIRSHRTSPFCFQGPRAVMTKVYSRPFLRSSSSLDRRSGTEAISVGH